MDKIASPQGLLCSHTSRWVLSEQARLGDKHG